MAPTLTLDSSRSDPFAIIPDSSTEPSAEELAVQGKSLTYYDISPLQQLPRLLYTPPVNFGMVNHRLYRSSFPQTENFPYLRKLGLKSVL